MDDLLYKLNGYNNDIINAGGDPVFDHISARIKSDRSMREKLARLGLAVTPEMALSENVHDAVGVRIVTCFIDDIFENIKQIRALKGVTVLEEKDYLTNAKPNGYRSYHLIISIEEPFEDAAGATPGTPYTRKRAFRVASVMGVRSSGPWRMVPTMPLPSATRTSPGFTAWSTPLPRRW